MQAKSNVNRQTVDLSGYPDLVVIYLGMKVRKPGGLLGWTAAPRDATMPRRGTDMNHGRTTLAAILVATLAAGTGASARASAREDHVLRDGHQDYFLGLFRPADGSNPVAPYTVDSLSIRRTEVEVGLTGPGGSTATIVVAHPSEADEAAGLPFAIRLAGTAPDAGGLALIVAARLADLPVPDVWAAEALEAPPEALKGAPDILGPDFESFRASFLVPSALVWAWLALAVLLAWVLARRRGDGPRALDLGLLLAGSWLLRLAVGEPGPGNPAIVFGHYGHAPGALLSLWRPLGGPTLTELLQTARFLGSLAPVFVALFVFELKPERRLALAAGILVAIQPLLVRFSSDCDRQSYVLFLGAVSLWALARHLRGRGLPELALHAVAALLCIESRPEAAAIVPLAAFLVWPGTPWKRDSIVALAVEALKRGAVDFVLKPWRNEALVAALASAGALPRQRRQSGAQLNLDDLERRAIERALSLHDGNISHAASALGLTRPALYRRMARHGL